MESSRNTLSVDGSAKRTNPASTRASEGNELSVSDEHFVESNTAEV